MSSCTKTMFQNIISVISFTVVILMPHACFSDETVFTDFLNSYRSNVLKDLIKSQYVELTGADMVKAQNAVDVFRDLQGTEVLYNSVKKISNYKLKSYVVVSLRGLVKKGDVNAVKQLLSNLEMSFSLTSGGTETALLRDQFRVNLVELVAEVSGESKILNAPKNDNGYENTITIIKEWLAKAPVKEK